MKLNHLHTHQGSPYLPIFRELSRSLHSHSSEVQNYFTPSIQPNLGLPRTRSPVSLAINSCLAIPYSSIRSRYPNQLNTLLYTLITNSLPIQAGLRTSLFPTIDSWYYTKNIHFYFFSHSHTPCHYSIQRHWYTYSSYRHYLAFIPILYYSAHFSGHPTIHSLHHIHFTSSICCHLRPQVPKTNHFLYYYYYYS